jgi:tetratricopeptide (TPR) repeat protein
VRQRRSSDAEQASYRAVAVGESLIADFPQAPGYRQLLGAAYTQHAYFLESTHRLDESEQAWRKAIRIFENLKSDYPKERRYLLPLLTARVELGIVLWATDQKPEARAQFTEFLALGRQIAPDQFRERFWLAWFLADCVDPQFRDPQSAANIAAALVREAPPVGEFWVTLGIARYRLGQYREAINAFNEATKRDMHYYYADRGYARLFLAMAHQALGERDAALEQYHKAIQQMETEYDWLWPRNNRAEAAAALGLPASANYHTAAGVKPPTPAEDESEDVKPPTSND